MIYFENTQDSQRIQIPRAANPTAVPVPSHEYRAGDNISIVGDVISVTGITSYPGYSAISGDVQSQVTGATTGLQETLVSGENIKTINGNSVLGSGNLVIAGGQAVSGGDYIEVTEQGVINVTGITSYPGYSAISGDVKSQIEGYDYATESQIPDVSEFVTSGDVQSQIEGYDYATKGDVTAATSGCQETLVSGENIKTVNGNSILGSGNLVISGGQAVSGGDNIEVTEEGVINVTGITSYPGYSAISGDVATQIDEAVSGITGGTTYQAGSNIDITNDTISVTGITSYPGYSAISGDVATQIDNAVSGITGGTSYTAGTNIDITNDTISVTGITSFPGFGSMTKTDVENALGYKPTSSGSVKTQIEAYNYVTSGDVATQVENYHYTTSGDVQSQITGATTGLQETLVSGTNIKTINSSSVLGSGNLEVGDVRGNGVTGLWTGTQVQYDAITAKSNTVLYFIYE